MFTKLNVKRQKWRRPKLDSISPCPRASVRPWLWVKIPGGGVLKSGYPGSDGEPGCGFSWLLGGHPGGVTRLPGAAWRAGQIQSAKMKKNRKKEKAYSTWYSQAVSHPSTNQARPCLASEIGRDRACSGWCGREQQQWWPVPPI